MSYADRDATLGDALRQQAQALLAAIEEERACADVGAWVPAAIEGESWTVCAACGHPRGVSHAGACPLIALVRAALALARHASGRRNTTEGA
jgi:hypothetical protein